MPNQSSTTMAAREAEPVVACKATSLGYSRGPTSYPPGAPVSVPEHVIAYEEQQHANAPRIVRLTGEELQRMDAAEAAALREMEASTAALTAIPTPAPIFDVPPEPAFTMDGRVSTVPDPDPPAPETEAAPAKPPRSRST